MSGSGVPCRAQDGGLQQLLDCIQTVRIRRCITSPRFRRATRKVVVRFVLIVEIHGRRRIE